MEIAFCFEMLQPCDPWKNHQLITLDKTHGRLIESAKGFPSLCIKRDSDVAMSFDS
jgi:hypothetical protein